MKLSNKARIVVFGGLLVIILAVVVLAVPILRDSVFFKIDQLYTRLFYSIKAPEQQAFIPDTPQATLTPAFTFTATPEPSATPTPEPDQATPTLSPTAEPLPELVKLDGVKYIDQHGMFNYCAPANLSMALAFWGWDGDRTDVGSVVKPHDDDFNVMPYELVDYVNQNTALRAIQRTGGNQELVKKLVANNFPVILEVGRYMVDVSGKLSWMGHYSFITGYDDEAAEFNTQDSYYTEDYKVSYTEMQEWWRAFNFVFIVVYPPEQEAQLFALLGDYADEAGATRIAYDTSTGEVWSLTGVQQYFAWFNRGSSMVDLQDYVGAAETYDQAFLTYQALPESDRPWRMLWYQTGPYYAYYLTGRYNDVIRLADQTFDGARTKSLEESYVWRARAYAALGSLGNANSDLCKALEYHPGFPPAAGELQSLGLTCE
jgi:tetratricopeptide (TPR) repeat protein